MSQCVLLDTRYAGLDHALLFTRLTLLAMQIRNLAEAVKATAESETYCSPLYRPPELYNCPHDCQLDGRIDVWAVGCILYYMMMGINPLERACQQGASLVLAVHKCAAIHALGAPHLRFAIADTTAC